MSGSPEEVRALSATGRAQGPHKTLGATGRPSCWFRGSLPVVAGHRPELAGTAGTVWLWCVTAVAVVPLSPGWGAGIATCCAGVSFSVGERDVLRLATP